MYVFIVITESQGGKANVLSYCYKLAVELILVLFMFTGVRPAESAVRPVPEVHQV